MRRLSVLILCLALPAFASEPVDASLVWLNHEDVRSVQDRLLDLPGPTEFLIQASCCKVCSKGKACGDSCISRDKQCRKGLGCACDG